jgi:hypothetical protein
MKTLFQNERPFTGTRNHNTDMGDRSLINSLHTSVQVLGSIKVSSIPYKKHFNFSVVVSSVMIIEQE